MVESIVGIISYKLSSEKLFSDTAEQKISTTATL